MFSLAWPWLLLLLPLPVVLRLLLPPCSPAGSALRVPFYQRLVTQSRPHLPLRRRLKLRYLYPSLVWLLLVLAAIRPQWLEPVRNLDMNGRSSMLAVDLSASMQTRDLGNEQYSRFDLTLKLLLKLLEQQPNDRFGLIFFATQAYLQAPLTFDHQSLRHWLHTAEPGIAGNNTAIGDATGLAIKQLRHLPSAEKNLILLTDGANNSGIMPPGTAARFAADEGIRIHALGIGQAAADSQAGPDQNVLQEMAQLTGGRYLHIHSPETLQNAIDFIQSLPDSRNRLRVAWQVRELYPWPLSIAVALALLHTLGSLLHIRLAGKPARKP